ncbi:MAG: histidine phosphatase family protein [Aquabacterium sp.]
MSSDHVTRLLVVRHGETAWNLAARIQGHIDIPLNDKGRWQARQVGQALHDEAIHALYSSDLLRARHTAEAIAEVTQLPLQLDAQLRERHFGRLEGMTQEEVATQWPEEARRWRERDPGYGPEGGETLQGFYDRCITTLTRLAHQHMGQTIAVVAHGGVLDCFYRAANRVPLQAPRTWHISNACINRLLYSPEGFSMQLWGDSRHLDDAPALDEATDGQVTMPAINSKA